MVQVSETWRPIAGFPLYEVSDFGRVRSLGCTVARQYRPGRVLKPSPRRWRNGRIVCVVVNLGRGNMRRVHHLVLEAFVGARPPGMEGCHGDGNPENNALHNLRWDTHQANIQDMIAHGTRSAPPIRRGAAHHRARLTPEDVAFIKAQPDRWGLSMELGRRFGVSHQTIRRVRDGTTWAHA